MDRQLTAFCTKTCSNVLYENLFQCSVRKLVPVFCTKTCSSVLYENFFQCSVRKLVPVFCTKTCSSVLYENLIQRSVRKLVHIRHSYYCGFTQVHQQPLTKQYVRNPLCADRVHFDFLSKILLVFGHVHIKL